MQDPNILPDALEMTFGVDVAGFDEPYSLMGYGFYQMFKETIATIFEDPTVDASDVEIHRDSRELVIRGTGFNDVARQVFSFDPPLDSSSFNVKVSSHGRVFERVYRSLMCKQRVVCCRCALRPTHHDELSSFRVCSRSVFCAPVLHRCSGTAVPHSAVRQLSLSSVASIHENSKSTSRQLTVGCRK